MAFSPFIGLSDVMHNPVSQHILFELRLPRVMLAFVIGAGLALCGMVF
jgi:ABC-type Fe3+-siderophore transport system permease subunit